MDTKDKSLNEAIREVMGRKSLRGSDVNAAGGPSLQHIHKVWNDDPSANAMMVLDKWAKGLETTKVALLKRAEQIAEEYEPKNGAAA